MRRREFITIVGSAAASWPLAARAQRPASPVIGFLNAKDPDYRAASFRSGLEDLGYVEDRNVRIEYRWAQGSYDRLPVMAAELVRLNVAVIAAGGGPAVAPAAKAATSTIPIVWNSASDSVSDGLVTSLNRPGGNVTGVSFLTGTLAAKQVEFVHAMVPNATPRQPSAQLHTAGKQTIAGMVVRGWIENQISDEAQAPVKRSPRGAYSGDGKVPLAHARGYSDQLSPSVGVGSLL
jgi:hypothetical protein